MDDDGFQGKRYSDTEVLGNMLFYRVDTFSGLPIVYICAEIFTTVTALLGREY